MNPRGVRRSGGDVGLPSRGGEAMTLTRSGAGGGGFDGVDSAEPTMESMLNASLGLLPTPAAVADVPAAPAVGELMKGFDDGAIGSMLNVGRPHVTIWRDKGDAAVQSWLIETLQRTEGHAGVTTQRTADNKQRTTSAIVVMWSMHARKHFNRQRK